MALRKVLSAFRASSLGAAPSHPAGETGREADALRHDRFVASRLGLGLAGLASLPPYLVWRGAPTGADVAFAICLSGPLVAAFVVTRAGARRRSRIGAGRGVSLAALAGLAALALRPPLPGFESVGDAVALCAGVAFAASVATLAAAALSGRRPVRAAPLAAPRDPILDNVDDLVTWHDRTGDVLAANAAAFRLLGQRPDSLGGAGLLRRVHVSDRPLFLKAIGDAGAGLDAPAVQIRLHAGPAARSGEGVVWVETRAYRATRPDGTAAVLAFIRDMTAFRRQADELEAARREAEAANETKSRFLATCSHELRTPLNAIIGFSELLAADHPFLLTPERRHEYATIISTSGHHLLEIVNTLLDMSKIEAGSFDFDPEPFALPELARSCCDLIRLKGEQAGVTLACEIADDLPPVTADRRACRQILTNLLSNAVKFTPAGGAVVLSVSAREGSAVLAVADTGIGIGEADLPRLGRPFFQAGELHRRQHEGTGLGLSVVRGLVGLHGGTLTVESGLGLGTTVTATLPLDGKGGGPAAGAARQGKPVTVAAVLREARPERLIA